MSLKGPETDEKKAVYSLEELEKLREFREEQRHLKMMEVVNAPRPEFKERTLKTKRKVELKVRRTPGKRVEVLSDSDSE
tara:strand:+ start:205 stop:441 length:237 start_codon:yes stop_codon:yes gene_type:complete